MIETTTRSDRRPYPAYRDSGTGWLGDVPAHWGVKPLKRTVQINSETLAENTAPDARIRYIDIGNVDALGRILDAQEMTFDSAPSRARRVLRDGDVIVSTVRTYLRAIASIEQAGEGLIASTGFAVLRPDEGVASRFMRWFATCDPFVDAIVSSSTGVGYPAIAPSVLGRLTVCVPPLDEQRAIAAYLDRETGRIDALVARKERHIGLLREHRQALIANDVFRGLDPGAPTIDEGKDWLSGAPAHWSVRRLKTTVAESKNGVWGDDPTGDDADLACIRVADFDRTRFTVGADEFTMRSIPTGHMSGRALKPGDLLLEKSGGGDLQPVGAVILFDLDMAAVCSNFVARVVVQPPNDSRFLTYLHAALYAGRVNTRSIKQSTGIQNLDQSSYLNERVALPPPDEQRAIAAHLDAETARIDALTATVRTSIARLREYRAALIAAVVTGRIDVRPTA